MGWKTRLIILLIGEVIIPICILAYLATTPA
jgi:hypothetical protein